MLLQDTVGPKSPGVQQRHRDTCNRGGLALSIKGGGEDYTYKTTTTDAKNTPTKLRRPGRRTHLQNYDDDNYDDDNKKQCRHDDRREEYTYAITTTTTTAAIATTTMATSATGTTTTTTTATNTTDYDDETFQLLLRHVVDIEQWNYDYEDTCNYDNYNRQLCNDCDFL